MHRFSIMLFVALAVAVASAAHAKTPPNVLIIMADDCTHNDLPLYGGKNAKTPNIDQLARESLTFNRAYLAEAMCQPCRAELYTGLYPMSNGCAWNHSASRPDVKSIPHYMKPLGYRVGLAGKVHVKPADAFPFEKVRGFDSNCVRNPTKEHEIDGIAKFLGRDAAPFCLVVALVEPHVPWVMGDASQYPPDKIELPPNIADTERTRSDYANYLAEITYMDGQVGEILIALDKSNKADDTLVLFTSEQGSQFPGNKWTNWDTGLHTALVARWPGKIRSGERTDAMVQYADVLPTLIELAVGETSDDAKPSIFDGRSFAPVLTGQRDTHRDFVYGVHNNIPEGPAYPIRTVSDGEFRYIQNLKPKELYIEKHLMGMKGGGGLNNPYWATWVAESWNTEKTYNLVSRYMSRPPEQLYNTATDPFELTNLADKKEHAATKQRLRAELQHWLKSQGDPGIPQDTMEAIQAARKGKHKYGPAITP